MNILIVEDDPRISGFLERGLRAEGHRTQLARRSPCWRWPTCAWTAAPCAPAVPASRLPSELLMSAPGRLFSRERILTNVWGISEDPLTNVVGVYSRRLRSKVDEGYSEALIHTVRGLGYRLEARAAC